MKNGQSPTHRYRQTEFARGVEMLQLASLGLPHCVRSLTVPHTVTEQQPALIENSMKQSQYRWKNRLAWDSLARKRDRLARPARDEDFVNPLKTVDGLGWLGPDIHGKTVLCLAAGGGRQGPLYAAAGAVVTVVDLSEKMLELDRRVAEQRRLNVRTIQASMDDLAMLSDATFDIVIHPVSTCYVPDVNPVYQEVARVLRSEGVYVSQHKQPASLQATVFPVESKPVFEFPYYREESLPPANRTSLVREEGTLEYIHRWEDLVGGMCRAGLVIQELVEPVHAKLAIGDRADSLSENFAFRSKYVPPYVRIKAKKSEAVVTQQSRRPDVWIPTD
jgi:SAM-dependent methyltransferase